MIKKECEVALNQIDEKGYSSVLKNAGIDQVLKIGIVFLGKMMILQGIKIKKRSLFHDWLFLKIWYN